jgi:hypothetical protein
MTCNSLDIDNHIAIPGTASKNYPSDDNDENAEDELKESGAIKHKTINHKAEEKLGHETLMMKQSTINAEENMVMRCPTNMK